MEMQHPHHTCDFCNRDNETVKGLVASPITGTKICYDCAEVATLSLMRKNQIEAEAKEISEAKKSSGTYVGGGPDCDCPSCTAQRMAVKDNILISLSIEHAMKVGLLGAPAGTKVN